jgi:hypothetical protein
MVGRLSIQAQRTARVVTLALSSPLWTPPVEPAVELSCITKLFQRLTCYHDG